MILSQIPHNYLLAGTFIVLLTVFLLLYAGLHFLMQIFVNSIFHKNGPGFATRLRNGSMYILFLLFFPIFLLIIMLKKKNAFTKPSWLPMAMKITEGLLILGVLVPFWIGLYYSGAAGTFRIVKLKLGYYEDQIPIAGTGSMYPTFPKGNGSTNLELSKETVISTPMMPYPVGLQFQGKRYFGYEVGKGDIVDFSNKTTESLTKESLGEEHGFVKRVIGLPGDSIELRDGIVYINEKPLQEQYTAKAHSTFGGDFLPDCQKVTVPEGELFVLGDNRKVSLDSRFQLGFISYADIQHIIPYEKQIGTLDKNWRDTSHDLENSTKIHLDRVAYIKLINEKRLQNNLPPLTYQPKLQASAEKRAKAMFTANLVSPEVKPGGLTMEKAFAEEGYIHHLRGELPAQGYYEADELFENQSEFIKSKEFLLKKEYQEIGIAEVEGNINGCPTQIIVQHLAGFVPPNYSKEDIEGFTSALNRVKDIQPGWENLKKNDAFYSANKSDVDRITEIIALRISHVQAIVNRMIANEWLTSQEQGYVDQEAQLFNEQQEIAKRLNEKLN